MMYDNYVRSDKLNWIDSIPATWEISRIKNLFDLRDERSFAPLNEVNLLSLYTSIGVVQNSDIKYKTGNRATNANNYKIVHENDIVVNIILCWMGAIGYSKYNGVTSPAYDVYSARDNVLSRYYHYLFRLPRFSGECYKNGHGIMAMRWRTYSPEFQNIVVPVPPREEQDQIVRYLDWKVSKINRLIEAKKKQIALLREQRHAVENRFLVPKTQKTDNDIGIKWECRALKRYVRSNIESISNSISADYELDYIDIGTVGFGYLKTKPIHYLFTEAPLRARRIVHYGDTIISTVRTYLRSMCYIDDSIASCIVSTGFSVLTPNSRILPKLLGHILCSDYFVSNVCKSSVGVSYPAISDTKLLSLMIFVPSDLAEQQIILDKITKQTALQERFITKIQKKISLLHELRTRLISDVVTGQMDVRGIEVPDFEMVEETVESEDEETTEECEEYE